MPATITLNDNTIVGAGNVLSMGTFLDGRDGTLYYYGTITANGFTITSTTAGDIRAKAIISIRLTNYRARMSSVRRTQPEDALGVVNRHPICTPKRAGAR
jgi:hypothetical protein